MFGSRLSTLNSTPSSATEPQRLVERDRPSYGILEATESFRYHGTAHYHPKEPSKRKRNANPLSVSRSYDSALLHTQANQWSGQRWKDDHPEEAQWRRHNEREPDPWFQYQDIHARQVSTDLPPPQSTMTHRLAPSITDIHSTSVRTKLIGSHLSLSRNLVRGRRGAAHASTILAELLRANRRISLGCRLQ